MSSEALGSRGLATTNDSKGGPHREDTAAATSDSTMPSEGLPPESSATPISDVMETPDEESIPTQRSNCFKLCRIIKDNIPSVLRFLLMECIEKKYPKEAWSIFLNKERKDCRINYLKKVFENINNIDQLDITSLSHALIDSSQKLLANYSKIMWRQHVKSLKECRNLFGHLPSTLVKTEFFDSTVKSVRDAYRGLHSSATPETKKFMEAKIIELEEILKEKYCDHQDTVRQMEISMKIIKEDYFLHKKILLAEEENKKLLKEVNQNVQDGQSVLQDVHGDVKEVKATLQRREEGDMKVKSSLQRLKDDVKALQRQHEDYSKEILQILNEGRKKERSHSDSSHEELSCGQQQQQKRTRVECVVDCKPKNVVKVIRLVSQKNLCHLLTSLIRHKNEKIINFINGRQGYVFEKHDYTVYFWFKICEKHSKLPSWKELIKSLNECDENVLANKVESGVVFEDSDDIELDGIHRPTSLQTRSHSNVSIGELPVPNPVTKEGKIIISQAYSHLCTGYEKLKLEVCELLNKQKVPFQDFLKCAQIHFPLAIATNNMKEFLQMAQQHEELSMWNYGPLEETVQGILGTGAKVKLLFNEYEENFQNYLTTTKIIDYLKKKDEEGLLVKPKQRKIFSIHCCDELGVKIGKEVEEKSLQYISSLWKSLKKRFNLAPITVILEDIREGCIYVVLNVPKEVSNALNTMSQKATDYFTSQKIRSVWIKGECVYYQDIHAKQDTAKAHFWLAQACESGSILEVNAILEVPDIDVNFLHIVNGKTPLMLASQEGHEEIVKVLLQRKALPNIKEDASGWSALFFAAHMGHEKVVKVLLEERADVLITDKEGSSVLDITKNLSKAYQLIDEATKTHLCLFEACEQGDLQKVHSIVEIPTTNVDTIRSDGKTPLIVAAQCGHPDIAVCLISYKANTLISDEREYVAADYVADGPDIWNPLREETLFTASAKGNAEVLKRILENKTDPNIKENDKEAYTPLMYACKNGHHEVVELLIQHKADPNYVANDYWTALLYACRNKHYTIVKTLLENNVNVNDQTADGWSPSMLVAADGSKEMFEFLLDHEADPELPDDKGYNSLIQAAQDGHCDIIELLVERDALFFPIEEYRTKNPYDWSALMFATKNGHTDIVKYIVNRDPDAALRPKEDGVTLLHLASYHGHVDLVKYFLFKLELNVDAQDEDGITPLMYAAQTGNLPIVKQLRQKIANVNLIEEEIGWNAAFIAMQYKNQDVLDYLLKCGVNFDHKDNKGNNLIQLSLIFNREAFRLIKAIYEKAASQKNVSPESVSSVGEPVMSFESLLGDIPSQDYSYIEEFGESFSRKVEIAAN